jgi:hypothetical protein
MAALDRAATIAGSMLIGIAVFLIVAGRTTRSQNRRSVPVEKLADDLKQAWAEHHIR